MQGTNQVIPMQGTNQVIPMQGTNQVIPMQGTNQVIPMQGTNQVIPMQGLIGEYYVDPVALIEMEEVPLNGLPDDYTDEDIQAYQLAYMYGDEDALNGLFSKVKQRRKGRKEARAAKKAERQEYRREMRATRLEKAKRGEGFLDKLGAAAGAVGAGLLKKAGGIADETAEDLDAAGIDYDNEILEQRAYKMAEDGVEPGTDSGTEGESADTGLMAKWNALSTPAKIGVAAGAAGVAYLIYKQLSKKKRR
jgi:hypothetical protein